MPDLSDVRTLEGRLVFHDDIRKWFELKLDQPQCGQASIQLVRGDRTWTPLQVLRGCRVRSRGRLGSSLAGSYSLGMYQDVEEVEPVGACVRQSLFPDYSKAKPDRTIREYRVDMHLQRVDHAILFTVSSAGKELRPWQAYADYYVTGGFVVYGFCGKGFVVDKVFGTPETNPLHFDVPQTPADRASFDLLNAGSAGKKDLHLGYTGVRDR